MSRCYKRLKKQRVKDIDGRACESLFEEEREYHHLTPMDGDIQSDVVLLNGKAP